MFSNHSGKSHQSSMKNLIIKTNLYFSILAVVVLCMLSFKTFAESSAYQVLQRKLGDSTASKFVLSQEGSSSENDWFEISVKQNKIYVTGNSPVALSKGAYSYIKDNNYGVVTWEGVNVKIPDTLIEKDYPRVTSSMPLRMYITSCHLWLHYGLVDMGTVGTGAGLDGVARDQHASCPFRTGSNLARGLEKHRNRPIKA